MKRLFLVIIITIILSMNLVTKQIKCYIVVNEKSTGNNTLILMKIEDVILDESYILCGYWEGIPMYRRNVESED